MLRSPGFQEQFFVVDNYVIICIDIDTIDQLIGSRYILLMCVM